jgi:glycosyltransferase involved in cell wall biosynthesis
VTRPSVAVITPTTCSETLRRALQSVREQTYVNVKHVVVIDGSEHFSAAEYMLDPALDRQTIIYLPDNVGRNGFYGHRIYAAFSFLTNEDIICFLDQDNWYDSDHVESLVETITRNKFDWAYSLRKIRDKSGELICHDNCESLGKWPIFADAGNGYLVDTSCYAFTRDYLQKVGGAWCHGWGGDRRFLNIITRQLGNTNYGCSGRYTLNYRLDGNEGSVKPEFFLQGNKVTEDFYGKDYPWLRKKI